MWRWIREYFKNRDEAIMKYNVFYNGMVVIDNINMVKRKKNIPQWKVEEFFCEVKTLKSKLNDIGSRYADCNILEEIEEGQRINIETLHDCESLAKVYLKIGNKICKNISWYLKPFRVDFIVFTVGELFFGIIVGIFILYLISLVN